MENSDTFSMNRLTLLCKLNDLLTNSCDSCVWIIKSLSHDFTIASNRDSDAHKACDKLATIPNIKYR